MAQSLGGVLDGLYSAVGTVFAASTDSAGQPVLVSFGDPGEYQPNAIVAVMGVRSPITRPTAGTNRSRDTHAEIDVVISVYVPGGPEAQQTATDEATALLTLLESNFRTSANEKIGGTCYDAWVSSADLVPSIAYQQFDDPNIPPAPTGRVCEITAMVTAAIRY